MQKCPVCRSPAHYVGFSSSECTNPECQWYFVPKTEPTVDPLLTKDFITLADAEDACAWITDELHRRIRAYVAGEPIPPWPKPLQTYMPSAGILAVSWPDPNTHDLYTWKFTF